MVDLEQEEERGEGQGQRAGKTHDTRQVPDGKIRTSVEAKNCHG